MSDPFDYRIHIGIRAPESKADAEDANTLDGMRRAIFRASRDSALVRNAMYAADVQGMSGEDRYVVLAYNALVLLESTHQRLMRCVERSPGVPLVFTDKKDGKGYT
jgi:hypothetical protein